jgi:DNA-binding GntR family transcriptional regulator
MNAYSFLKDKILNCEILPGQYINEKELVQTSNFGRTPIREAFIMLQAEKLIEVIPRKGTYAKKIAKGEITDMYMLRKILEPAVAIQFRMNLDLQHFLKLDADMKTLCASETFDYKAFYEQDISFHRFIAYSCKNARIIGTLEPLFQETYRIGMFNRLSNTENAPEKTYEQHHRITMAILSEDVQEIHDSFLIHLNSSLISSLASLNN